MLFNRESLKLYAITDSKYSLGNENLFFRQVEDALAGGATSLQLREKSLEKSRFLERAQKLKNICQKFKVPLIINDDVDIAKKIDADGVHIGQDDMSIIEAKEILGNKKIIGVSVFNAKEAFEAESRGASYLGVGSIFKTISKPDAKMVKISDLKEICKIVKIPVVAIGGINKDNILKLRNSGVSGVALIRAIFSSRNIKEETEKLRKFVELVL